MPPVLLFDLSKIDLNAKPIYDKEAICKVNPQSYEMQQLDGIVWFDKEEQLMPGVIMVECAAQLLSFFIKQIFEEDGFIGFAGIDDTKFRSVVEPGQRLYLLGKIVKYKKKARTSHVTTNVQGIVDGKMVFETTVSGMRV